MNADLLTLGSQAPLPGLGLPCQARPVLVDYVGTAPDRRVVVECACGWQRVELEPRGRGSALRPALEAFRRHRASSTG